MDGEVEGIDEVVCTPFCTKGDVFKAAIVGLLIACCTVPIALNLKAAAVSLAIPNISRTTMLVGWFLFLSLGSAGGLAVAGVIAVRYWGRLLQIAKYGLVGLLNSFLSASIVNLLMYMTHVEQGWLVTGFFVLTFVFTVTHSFFWNKYWIFSGQSFQRTRSEYVRFFAVTSSVLTVITGLFHILINVVGPLGGMHPRVWVNVVLVLLSVVTFLGNYIGYTVFVFRSTKSSQEV